MACALEQVKDLIKDTKEESTLVNPNSFTRDNTIISHGIGDVDLDKLFEICSVLVNSSYIGSIMLKDLKKSVIITVYNMIPSDDPLIDKECRGIGSDPTVSMMSISYTTSSRRIVIMFEEDKEVYLTKLATLIMDNSFIFS